MKIQRRRFLGITVLLVGLLTVGISARAGDKEEVTIRWDIVSVQPGNLLAGGIASARNNNNDKITVTGSGTFVPGDPEEVTGGGDFTIVDMRGRVLFKGMYEVTELVSFELGPGRTPPGFINDTIGNLADLRAGLVFLRIRYSDGNRGILVVGCHLPEGTPPAVMEGITASHAFVDFWNREAPQDGPPFVDANRTAFHIVREAED